MEVLQATARVLVEWMVYCLIEGSVLALFVWLLLRLLPRQNAGTRFTLWFSVLLAMVALPLVGGPGRAAIATSQNGTPNHGLISLSSSWAFIIFLAWVSLAAVALARVAAGLWQVSRLRRESREILPAVLGQEVQSILASARPVSLRISDRVQVPTAIGFFKPAILVPGWFLEEISPAELKHVLLHELSHLRRHDDWTNLAQKIIKALLFFHPSVWWVEQRLSLEREMACDDAVLAQAASPQDYANCLRHVAEKSFLRRQLALAQAVVNRMRQLSLRVAQILDANRPNGTHLWRPAVPVVLAAASLCGLSAWNAPAIVSFKDNGQKVAATSSPASFNHTAAMNREVTAPHLVLANATLRSAKPAEIRRPARIARTAVAKSAVTSTAQRVDYVVSEQIFVTFTGTQQKWQMHVWQVRMLLPVNNYPDNITPRKKT